MLLFQLQNLFQYQTDLQQQMNQRVQLFRRRIQWMVLSVKASHVNKVFLMHLSQHPLLRKLLNQPLNQRQHHELSKMKTVLHLLRPQLLISLAKLFQRAKRTHLVVQLIQRQHRPLIVCRPVNQLRTRIQIAM